MCLPESRIAEQQQVFCCFQVAPFCQFQDAGLGKILDGTKIVGGDFLDKGEFRHRDGALNAPGLAFSDFYFTQSQQISLEGETRSCSILSVGLVLVQKHGKFQFTQIRFQPRMMVSMRERRSGGRLLGWELHGYQPPCSTRTVSTIARSVKDQLSDCR